MIENDEPSPYTQAVLGCRKIVAAFVLIWALADMTVPGLCQADDNRVDPVDSLLLLVSQEQTPPAWSSAGLPLPSQDGAPDECFCCSPYACPTSIHSGHACVAVHALAGAILQAPFSIALVVQPTQSLFQRARDSLADSSLYLALPLRC